MEYLKKIFGESALTFSQLEQALKDNKDVKLANLAEGKYVDKEKLDGKIAELMTANTTIQNLQTAVNKFDGVDLEKLKKDVTDWETKYNNDISAVKLSAALDTALMGAKVRDVKAVKPFLDMELIKLDGEKVLGLDEQLKLVKESKGFLFEDSTEKPILSTGMRQTGTEGTIDKKEEANTAIRGLFGKEE